MLALQMIHEVKFIFCGFPASCRKVILKTIIICRQEQSQ